MPVFLLLSCVYRHFSTGLGVDHVLLYIRGRYIHYRKNDQVKFANDSACPLIIVGKSREANSISFNHEPTVRLASWSAVGRCDDEIVRIFIAVVFYASCRLVISVYLNCDYSYITMIIVI